jgi:hypothetical protein
MNSRPTVTRTNCVGGIVTRTKRRWTKRQGRKDQLFKFGSQYIDPFSVSNILPLLKQNSEGSGFPTEWNTFNDALLALFQLPL